MERNIKDLTLKELLAFLKKQGAYIKGRGDGSITWKQAEAPDADKENEVRLNPSSPSFFKNTKPFKESSYYDYAFKKNVENVKGGKA